LILASIKRDGDSAFRDVSFFFMFSACLVGRRYWSDGPRSDCVAAAQLSAPAIIMSHTGSLMS